MYMTFIMNKAYTCSHVFIWSRLHCRDTVEPRYNDPQYNDIPGIAINMLCPGKSYSKMYGTEPWYNNLPWHIVISGFHCTDIDTYHVCLALYDTIHVYFQRCCSFEACSRWTQKQWTRFTQEQEIAQGLPLVFLFVWWTFCVSKILMGTV